MGLSVNFIPGLGRIPINNMKPSFEVKVEIKRHPIPTTMKTMTKNWRDGLERRRRGAVMEEGDVAILDRPKLFRRECRMLMVQNNNIQKVTRKTQRAIGFQLDICQNFVALNVFHSKVIFEVS